MAIIYNYIKAEKINIDQLKDEISVVPLPIPTDVQIDDVNVQISYDSDLTVDQKINLDSVVGNHVANPSYVTIAAQAQVTTLLGYLNNANTTIANTARAVIVANLAPKLPVGLIASINSQIAIKLGI